MELRPPDSQSICDSGRKIFDRYVRLRGQLLGDRDMSRILEVQCNASLRPVVSIEIVVVVAGAAFIHNVPHLIPMLGLLNFYDVRPHIGEHHRCEGAGDYPCKVKDFNVSEACA